MVQRLTMLHVSFQINTSIKTFFVNMENLAQCCDRNFVPAALWIYIDYDLYDCKWFIIYTDCARARFIVNYTTPADRVWSGNVRLAFFADVAIEQPEFGNRKNLTFSVHSRWVLIDQFSPLTTFLSFIFALKY